MKLNLKYVAVCSLLGAFAGGVAALAQDSGPPKLLYIVREFTKPGKTALHEKSEAAYAAAMAAAKAPNNFFALESLTGPDRALFINGYDSFEDMSTQHKAMMKIPGLGATMDRLGVTDGELLTSTDESLWLFKPKMSMNPGPLKGVRMMELELFIVKPGRNSQWSELVKLVQSGYAKGVPNANWAMFDQAYGQDGNAHLAVTMLKSGKEIDQTFASGKQFEEALGPDGMKKLNSLMAACVQSSQTNLFGISPRMSNPEPGMVAAEPEFWKTKPAPVKKHEEKHAQ
ncbi:MAG: hypothetical protein ABI142_07190 [Bryocella sp.]